MDPRPDEPAAPGASFEELDDRDSAAIHEATMRIAREEMTRWRSTLDWLAAR